mmetsp:Transcript_16633/g.14534  ORF Transcript_16633/g.14534 Transcript_16633/m.14534 type:complete len:100 (-) Transcript_16633:25-324(-)
MFFKQYALAINKIQPQACHRDLYERDGLDEIESLVVKRSEDVKDIYFCFMFGVLLLVCFGILKMFKVNFISKIVKKITRVNSKPRPILKKRVEKLNDYN